MYHQLKEAINTYIQYRKRLPLVIGYSEEVTYFNDRKNVPQKEIYNTPFEEIQYTVQQCNKCKTTEKYTIQGRDVSSELMIILNPPAMLSNVEKKVLMPDVTTMIEKMMKAIHIKPESCYITHMIKCEGDELPGKMFSECQKILIKEIEVVKPRVIIVMGEIRPLQRIVKTSSGIQWFNIEHPITLIKNPELKRGAWNTLQTAKAALQGN